MANLKATKVFLEAKLAGFRPDVALVTGSGLAGITQDMGQPVVVPYSEIPHFPKPTVTGHAGQLICGELAGKRLLVFSGRFHYYEGRSLEEIVYPIDVADALGARRLIVTNAAGGINPRFSPGDLMVIADHINLMGVNPLIGRDHYNRFTDMSQAYSPRLREKLRVAAKKLQTPIWQGVYLATSGPSYETPAEINAFGRWGADAVGMSTVPEVIVARYHDIEVAGVSCITNLAAGIGTRQLAHEEVIAVGNRTAAKLGKLLTEFLGTL